MKTQLFISIKIFVILTMLTGIVYPLLITGIAQSFFHKEANGSLIYQGEKIIGSELIGQEFKGDKYFWPRPSANDYQPMPSGGSNMGVIDKKLQELYFQRKDTFINKNNLPLNTGVPSEMLFASASGVDPHISVTSAFLQANRVIKARQLDSNQTRQLYDLINTFTDKRQLFVLGENRINVLLLNIETDKMFKNK